MKQNASHMQLPPEPPHSLASQAFGSEHWPHWAQAFAQQSPAPRHAASQ